MTAEHYQGHLGKGLVYEDSVPLTHTTIAEGEKLTPSQTMRNLRVLRILWLLQESGQEIPEEYGSLEPVLLRMESKLDLLVELLGQFLSEELGLPGVQPVKITSQRLMWRTDETLTAGSHLQIKCYLIPNLPLPWVVNGEVEGVEATAEGNWVSLSLEELDEQSAEVLDKIIFRNHRRAIARQRQHT